MVFGPPDQNSSGWTPGSIAWALEPCTGLSDLGRMTRETLMHSLELLAVRVPDNWTLQHFDEGFKTVKHTSSILLYVCLSSISKLVDITTAPAKWRSNAHTLSISTLCISTWAKSLGSTDTRKALFFRFVFSKWQPFTSSHLFALNKSKNNFKR